jgi:uncharacterized membrane protein YqhA
VTIYAERLQIAGVTVVVIAVHMIHVQLTVPHRNKSARLAVRLLHFTLLCDATPTSSLEGLFTVYDPIRRTKFAASA